jgi:hypothetical protein
VTSGVRTEHDGFDAGGTWLAPAGVSTGPERECATSGTGRPTAGGARP